MEQSKFSTKCAGIDVSKAQLDAGLARAEDRTSVANREDAFEALGTWLKTRGIVRVGIEATGGYERAVVEWLRAAGFEVIVFQPKEVRLFARFRRIRAKTDKIDARVIALAAAYVDGVKAANDPRLAELAERLTAYEQAADMLALAKTHREHITLADLKASKAEEIKLLTDRKKALKKDLLKRLKLQADLMQRYRLLRSIPGIGELISAALVIRMPELGQMEHGQAPSLIGVAPFNRDSGKHVGKRFIQGGRSRPRRHLYMAALTAKRTKGMFHTLEQRLLAAGKEKKVAIVAVMRKLIEAANLVLKRQTPWTKTVPA